MWMDELYRLAAAERVNQWLREVEQDRLAAQAAARDDRTAGALARYLGRLAPAVLAKRAMAFAVSVAGFGSGARVK